jgi:hypothetical protein
VKSGGPLRQQRRQPSACQLEWEWGYDIIAAATQSNHTTGHVNGRVARHVVCAVMHGRRHGKRSGAQSWVPVENDDCTSRVGQCSTNTCGRTDYDASLESTDSSLRHTEPGTTVPGRRRRGKKAGWRKLVVDMPPRVQRRRESAISVAKLARVHIKQWVSRAQRTPAKYHTPWCVAARRNHTCESVRAFTVLKRRFRNTMHCESPSYY